MSRATHNTVFACASEDPPDAALEVIDQVARELKAADRDRLSRLDADLEEIVTSGIVATRPWDDPVERLERTLRGDTVAERRLLAALAYRRVRLATSAELALVLADRGLAGGRLLDDGIGSPLLFAVGIALGLAGRTDDAERLFGEIAARAGQSSSPAVRCAALGQRGVERYHRGMLPQAQHDLQSALGSARGQLWEMFIDDRRPHLIRVHAERGAFTAAEDLLLRWSATGTLPETARGNHLLVERGRLRLVQGRSYEALADLACARQRLSMPADELLFDWCTPAALAYYRLGEHRAALELAEEQLEIAKSWGAARQLGRAIATLALINGGSTGIASMREAVEILESSTAHLERARVLIDLGALLRRAGRVAEARVRLREGLELAVRVGTPRLAERAHQELIGTGLERRKRTALSGPDALTPTEHRVARMAADGLSNPEISRTLFVTRKTVEMHLGNVYRKLGIRSRRHVRSVLGSVVEIEKAEACEITRDPDARPDNKARRRIGSRAAAPTPMITPTRHDDS